MKFHIGLVAFLVVCCVEVILGQTPIGCTWTNPSTGTSYDISGLLSSNDYKIEYAPPDTKKNIWLNLCRPVIYNLCGSNIAACQQWDPANRNGQASLGIANTMSFSYGQQYSGEGGLMVTFTGGTVGNNIARSMEIDFTCQPGAGAGSPTFVTENQVTLKYYFTWSTQFACGSGGTTTGGPTGGLSGGSIFLIIFFVGIVVYFGAGIAYMRFKNHAEGINMIPNLEFWAALPSLVKDGVMFLVGKVRGRGASSYQTVK